MMKFSRSSHFEAGKAILLGHANNDQVRSVNVNKNLAGPIGASTYQSSGSLWYGNC